MMPLFVATTTTTTIGSSNQVMQMITEMVGYISASITAINWAAPTWDLFLVLFFIVTVFLYGMSLGRDRIIVILVSIYMALAVVSNAPLIGEYTPNADVNIGNLFAFKISMFIGLFMLLFFLLSRSALMKTFGNMEAGKWWQVLIFSTFHVGLLVSVTLSFLPADSASHLAPLTQQIFATDLAKFIWVIAPIAGMVLLKNE